MFIRSNTVLVNQSKPLLEKHCGSSLIDSLFAKYYLCKKEKLLINCNCFLLFIQHSAEKTRFSGKYCSTGKSKGLS